MACVTAVSMYCSINVQVSVMTTFLLEEDPSSIKLCSLHCEMKKYEQPFVLLDCLHIMLVVSTN